jgi:hypothetical protein
VTTERVLPDAGTDVVADRFLDASHLAAARAVLAKVVDADEVRVAFVGGSLAAGLGHGLSDVDLYVATRSGAALEERGHVEGGYVVQINPLTGEQFDRVVSICSGFRATATDRWQTQVDENELHSAVRYAIGTVLAADDSAPPAREEALLTVRRILMTRNAYALASLAEDALGALDIGDQLTALQASLVGLEHAVECVLAGVGDAYVGRKFALRRLARSAALRPLLPEIWAGLRNPAAPPGAAAAERIVTRRMLLAGHLVASAMLDGWDAAATRIPAVPTGWDGGGPVRSPWVVPVRFADAWGMVGPDVGYRTKQGMVRVWRELDGRSVDEVHRGFAADPALAGTRRELLDTAVRQLVERNVAGSATPSSERRGG